MWGVQKIYGTMVKHGDNYSLKDKYIVSHKGGLVCVCFEATFFHCYTN